MFGIQAFLECGARGRGLYRAVDPETVGMHVHKCKGVLESVSLYLMDWPRAVTSDRKRRRKVLPNVIDQLPRHVRELSLVYWACPPRDENCDPPNLLDEGETEDALTMSLRRFYMRQKAQRLFVSHMVLGPEFYKRPGKGDRGHGTPSGPDVRTMTMMLMMTKITRMAMIRKEATT